MRPSLENIAYIENYILGNFDPEEQERAKHRIDNSPELSQLLEKQQCIYLASRRKALRAEIQSYAHINPPFLKRYRSWFIGGLAVLIGAVCFLAINLSNTLKKQPSDTTKIASNSKKEKDIIPWIPFDLQYFDLIAEKGSTIVGKDGTLIILGANSLLDSEGKRVKGEVQAELIEAIDLEDMIAYNLTTTSNGKALSSGGMMRIRYRQEGEEVFVDPKKPMHVEIPTDSYDPEMQVWEGQVIDDQLDWKNPQEIERYLKQVDLRYLDFLPSGFDMEVASLLPYNGHISLSDHLVDSLYYSISKNRELFANRESLSSFQNDCNFNIPIRKDQERNGGEPFKRKPQLAGKHTVIGQIVDTEGQPIAGMDVKLRMDRYLEHSEVITTDSEGKFSYNRLYPGEVVIYASLHSANNIDILSKYCLKSSFKCPKSQKKHTLVKPLVAEYSSMVNFDRLTISPKTNGSFIDPLKIKTLKTSRFQNTFIATKEFERRLQVMHQLEKGSLLLDTYISNLSEPMWKCDEMATKLVSGEERVIFENFAKERLTNVQNSGIHQEELFEYYSQQCKDYRRENRRRLEEYQSKTIDEINALASSIENALNSPGQLAVSQASHKGWGSAKGSTYKTNTIGPGTKIRTQSYAFSWSSSSWCNVDRYMKLLGPSPWTTAITTNVDQEGLVVYRTIPELQSIIGLDKQNGIYNTLSPKSNAREEVICLAICREGEKILFGGNSFDPVTTRDLILDLESVTEDEFYLKICSLAPLQSSISQKLKADYNRLNTHIRINNNNQRYTNLLASARNEISADIILYNRLFEFLDRSNKTLNQ